MANASAPVPDMGGAMISPNAPPAGLLPPPMGRSPNGTYDPPATLPSSQQLPSSAVGGASMLPSASRSVKRPRPVKSCTECRKRKLKCDRNLPCAQCQKSHRQCKYAADHDSSALSDISDTEAGDLQRPPKRNCLPSVQGAPGAAMHLGPPFSSVQHGEANGASPIEALASRVDRLEHYVLAKSPYAVGLGGSLRLQLHPEMIRGLTVKAGAERTRFFGQGSVRVLINLVCVCSNPLPIRQLLSVHGADHISSMKPKNSLPITRQLKTSGMSCRHFQGFTSLFSMITSGFSRRCLST